jgi:hypothetical protein
LSNLAFKSINSRANLLKKWQKIANILQNGESMIQKWAPFAMQCYAGKNRTEMAIFHLCALYQNGC